MANKRHARLSANPPSSRVQGEHLRAGSIFGVFSLWVNYGMRLDRLSPPSTDGSRMWANFVFHEIVAPERLVFIVSFSDEQGKAVLGEKTST